MVDFNSGELLASNKGEILNFIILERRDKAINTLELYFESKINNTSQQQNLLNKFRASLMSLYLEVCEALERKIKDYDTIKSIVFAETEQDAENLLIAFRSINRMLDEINLIKIDTRKQYDTTNIEEENFEKGL